jgi:hypothetical protein
MAAASLGRPESFVSKSPIVVLAGDDRIAATKAQSAGIFCGSDSAIAFSAIGIGLLDVIGGDYAAVIRPTANESCFQRLFINGRENISSTRGAGIGAAATLTGRPSRASQFAISGGNFEVRDGRGDRLRLRQERDRCGRNIVRPQRGRRAEHRRLILQCR